MKKILWIDIGAHFAQEYNSIFGSNIIFYLKLIKRLFFKIFIGRKFINFNETLEFIKLRKNIRKKRDDFLVIFVEANPKIISSKKVYLDADMVFNVALTDNSEKKFFLTKLYLANNDELSQGSSVYKNKKNINTNDYVSTFGVSSYYFMELLKKELDRNLDNYNVFLRLNCEGVEDSIIYAAHKFFNKDLKLVLGSFKDVKEIKGDNAFQDLNRFMSNKNIKNLSFGADIDSWFETYKEINKFIFNNK